MKTPGTDCERATRTGKPFHAYLVLAACAAGLAVVVVLGLVGSDVLGDDGSCRQGSSMQPALEGAAALHRRQLFGERRRRFDAAQRAAESGSTGQAPVAADSRTDDR